MPRRPAHWGIIVYIFQLFSCKLHAIRKHPPGQFILFLDGRNKLFSTSVERVITFETRKSTDCVKCVFSLVNLCSRFCRKSLFENPSCEILHMFYNLNECLRNDHNFIDIARIMKAFREMHDCV